MKWEDHAIAYAGRHPGTQELLRFLCDTDHLGHIQGLVANEVADVALYVSGNMPDGPELTSGLRKLLEAKDCLVRHSLLLPLNG